MTKSTLSISEFDTLMIDWIDGDGHISAINDFEARELGIEATGSLTLERVYSSTSAQLLRAIARGEQTPEASFPVWVNSPRYSEIPMVASAVRDAKGGLAVIKQVLSPSVLDIGPELVERVEILSQMIGAATEACWCIDFLEPVDISLAQEEIVGRIFSNQSRWRACNEAMARLYRVPEGLDFNTQPVSRYFPDTDINRQMIRDLVRSNYRLDHATAVDRRHDGSEMIVENDFRAAIKDGLLIRLWGTTRDIGPYIQREQQLSDRADTMLDILSATPDPILVMSEEGIVLAANPATEAAWGRSADQILGRPIQRFIETRNAVEKLRQATLDDDSELDLGLISADDSRDVWRFRAALMEGETRRYVLTARRKTKRRTRRLAEEAV
ncbi:PAS domain-containing protein [Rhizobium sp. S95]|uniref:PAS domain-containing protein n=1 Tax=Ciceribacter sichuanensis TaxID=2949647 RepID=A0AAJ1F962_9HYPH|nr:MULTISPECIES: PAS domain-containing protein [unclassified Ciceribacter]MCM2396009.1 PAS domain-containing protein [Ciceribacter sp. S95]MCM2404369.1 PAS domain-containing protein [Ciceribacter sp. S153]MCO5959677.1 PAS domain-containing protein [Ciceribacter sp. S101]